MPILNFYILIYFENFLQIKKAHSLWQMKGTRHGNQEAHMRKLRRSWRAKGGIVRGRGRPAGGGGVVIVLFGFGPLAASRMSWSHCRAGKPNKTTENKTANHSVSWISGRILGPGLDEMPYHLASKVN